MPPTQHFLDQIALSWDEYHQIVERLDREPNDVELGMIGALWSEHCGYKNSRPLLKLFPTESPRVLTRVGTENAGVVGIGDGWCVAMKIESHNHPSAIEPYQGAATGVGGIVRDVFAMGARPIAILDSLRFGPLTDPASGARNRYLFGGVVGGIGWYGNCLGIPTVAGEVSFAPTYSENPLVNAMCVGVARIDRLARARADGPGNVLLLIGADTGRDGIHGATFASVELDEHSEERRPAVQVGNPFMEKLLMEACLELAEEHGDWIVGIQDLGAAGLTSSSVESASKAGTGLSIDLAKVPRRERGMTPYELMLSESQERMLVIARKEHLEDVRRLLERWELHVAEIGRVTDDGIAHIREDGAEVARVPVQLATDPPAYVRDGVKPRWLDELQSFDPASLPDLPEADAGDALLRMLGAPEIASKRYVWRQYDHQVGANTVVVPGSDAAVIRVRGTRRGIALTTDGNGIYCYLEPYQGGALAVAEAARNVVCAGATPIAVTDCLNFGNPEKPDVYYQMEQCVRGMAEACRVLATPVISGNVSLYNETAAPGQEAVAVYPTPVVGMLGLLEEVERVVPSGFAAVGDAVLLAGTGAAAGDTLEPVDAASLGGSEYLREFHQVVAGRPSIDLDLESRLQRFLLAAAERGLLRSAHDCSHGGLAVTLAESCLDGDLGLQAALPPGRLDAALFGEAQSRVVVSCQEADLPVLRELAAEHDVPLARLGSVRPADEGLLLTRGGLPAVRLPLSDLRDACENGLPAALAAPAVSG